MSLPHPFISSYLVEPRIRRPRRRINLHRWIIRVRLIWGTNSKLASNLTLGVAAWLGILVSLQFLTTPMGPDGRGRLSLNSQLPLADLVSGSPATAAKPVTAPVLPGGPTGYQLQPTSLAPHRTYSNTYAWGQCTWYVAGRRPIPPRWGDAERWYYNAVASGWRVGSTPAIGAIAWTAAGPFGHVALVENVSANGSLIYISEMNYRGLNVRSTRWVPTSYFKYIY